MIRQDEMVKTYILTAGLDLICSAFYRDMMMLHLQERFEHITSFQLLDEYLSANLSDEPVKKTE